ncbi:MAG: hypothetical protein KBS60_07860, partial [Phascolarctobacterium sp.]|nr:hypothetical protein [Candidatus Phascolarctobacterium caballi]
QDEQTKEKTELQKGDEKEKTTEYKEQSTIKCFLITILTILIIGYFGYFYNTNKISREMAITISVSIGVVVFSYMLGVFSNKKKPIDRVQNFLTLTVIAVICGYKIYSREWDGEKNAKPIILGIMITVSIISAVLRRIYEKFVKGENKNE